MTQRKIFCVKFYTDKGESAYSRFSDYLSQVLLWYLQDNKTGCKPTLWMLDGKRYVRIHDFNFDELNQETYEKYLDERVLETDELLSMVGRRFGTKFNVIEDLGGGLTLIVFASDGKTVEYVGTDYEYAPGELRKDIDLIRNGADPANEWGANKLNDPDLPFEVHDGFTPYDMDYWFGSDCRGQAWNIVADEEAVYPKKMGYAARRELLGCANPYNEESDTTDYYGAFIAALMDQPYDQVGMVWSDGEDILCSTSDGAETVADLLEALYRKDGQDCRMTTGYFDPIEDSRTGETDLYSGWYYVTI